MALLVALLLLFQLLPVGTVLAAGTGRNLLESSNPLAVIHNSTGEPNLDWAKLPAGGLKSSIEINGATPDLNGNYANIPAGAKIDLWVAFHLKNEDNVEYKANDYFEMELPAGLSFNPATGPVTIEKATRGTWAINGSTLSVVLNGEIEAVQDNIWARINIKGSFQYLEDAVEGAESTKLKFGEQEITITRKPKSEDPKPPANSTITKEKSYNPATNKITWTVTITPPRWSYGYSL